MFIPHWEPKTFVMRTEIVVFVYLQYAVWVWEVNTCFGFYDGLFTFYLFIGAVKGE